MKIISENKIYVQKRDIRRLYNNGITFPDSVYEKLLPAFINHNIDGDNELVEFNTYDAIEFFNQFDWIIDYHEIKDLNRDELLDLAVKITEEAKDKVDAFKKLSKEERDKALDTVANQFDDDNYKRLSLVLYINGELTVPVNSNTLKKDII